MLDTVRLVYISDATIPFSDFDLTLLGQRSAETNATWSITGILLYSAGHFMQCLEGERVTVLRIFERITADPRHRNVSTVLLESAPRRLFSSWSMGVLNLDMDGLELNRTRLLDVLNAARQTPSTPGATIVVKVLKEFRKQLRAAPSARG